MNIAILSKISNPWVKRVVIGLGIVFVLWLIALITYAIAIYVFPDKVNLTDDNDGTPQGIIDKVTLDLQSNFSSEDILSITQNDTAPYRPVNNSLFYVNYEGGNAAAGIDINYEYDGLVTTAEIAQQRSAIISSVVNSLKAKGLTKQADDGYGSAADVYADNDFVCTVDNPNDTTGTPPPLSVLCGSTAAYTTDLDTYKTAKKFSDIYVKAGNTVEKGDIFEALTDTDSNVEADLGAKISYGNLKTSLETSLLFYTTNGNDWNYFASTQSIPLPCSNYSSNDLRVAFAGDTCIGDNNIESTVR